MPYPVSIAVEPQLEQRNRLTVGLRLILSIPHAVLVGPIFVVFRAGGMGLLAAAVYFLAIVSWFTILINNEHIQGIRDLSLYYLRWRTRAIAYMTLLVDPYPPFGDGPYPASIEVVDPALPRDSTSVAVRLHARLDRPTGLVHLFTTTAVNVPRVTVFDAPPTKADGNGLVAISLPILLNIASTATLWDPAASGVAIEKLQWPEDDRKH